MFKKREAETGLEKAAFRECTADCGNPGRGWYQIHTFVLGKEEEEGREIFTGGEEETLALVLIDIGAYRSAPLAPEALFWFTQILEAFRIAGKEMILRVVYDREGKGMEKEPSLFPLVLTHMKQIGPVLKAYADDILLVQGLFVGSWGEMHSSKFLSPEKLKEMFQVLDEASGETLRFALRRPVQVRMIYSRIPEKSRIGFFDDAMFASENDLGTFGAKKYLDAGWEKEWERGEELIFAGSLSSFVPCGGEAIAGKIDLTPEMTLEVLKEMHVSYLNCIYDEKILTKWKQIAYQGWKSLYDYIGAHMGYRFVVRDAAIRHRKELQVILENVGFANLCEIAELYLIVETDSDTEQIFRASYDIRTLRGGECAEIIIEFDGAEKGDTCYLKLVREKDKKCIRFANQGAEKQMLLGRITN